MQCMCKSSATATSDGNGGNGGNGATTANTCTCPNGTPTVGTGTGATLCATNSAVDCSACGAGYTLSAAAGVGAQTCVAKDSGIQNPNCATSPQKDVDACNDDPSQYCFFSKRKYKIILNQNQNIVANLDADIRQMSDSGAFVTAKLESKQLGTNGLTASFYITTQLGVTFTKKSIEIERTNGQSYANIPANAIREVTLIENGGCQSKCKAGKTRAEPGGVCSDCDFGKARLASDEKACIDCIVGLHGPLKGAPACVICANGKFQDQVSFKTICSNRFITIFLTFLYVIVLFFLFSSL